MENINTSKQENSNRNLLLLLVALLSIGCTSFVWWYFSKPNTPTITKGSFPSVKVSPGEVKPIPKVIYVPVPGETILKPDYAEIEKFKKLYNLSQAEYDSLVIQYSVLDSLAMATNDKYYQALYEKCKPVEFSHIFDNDTIKATVSGISNGAPNRLKLDWEIKTPKPKEIILRLLAGGEFGMTKSFDKINTKGSIIGQFKNGNQVSVGIDTEQRFYFGGAVSIFKIKN